MKGQVCKINYKFTLLTVAKKMAAEVLTNSSHVRSNVRYQDWNPCFHMQVISLSSGFKICFAKPSDKMSDDFGVRSDISSSLTRTAFASNVRSFTTDFSSNTLNLFRLWFVTSKSLLINTRHFHVVFQCCLFSHVVRLYMGIEVNHIQIFCTLARREKQTKLHFGQTLIRLKFGKFLWLIF